MTLSTGPSDPILGRLDRLAGRYVPLLLRLDPFDVSRIIDRLLADIGEAIGAGQISFAAAGDSASHRTVREWTRPGSNGPSAAAITVPVAVGGRRLGAL